MIISWPLIDLPHKWLCWQPPSRQCHVPEESLYQVAILLHLVSIVHAQARCHAHRLTHPSVKTCITIGMTSSHLYNPTYMFLVQDTKEGLSIWDFTALIISTWSIDARPGTWANNVQQAYSTRIRTAISAKRGTSTSTCLYHWRTTSSLIQLSLKKICCFMKSIFLRKQQS